MQFLSETSDVTWLTTQFHLRIDNILPRSLTGDGNTTMLGNIDNFKFATIFPKRGRKVWSRDKQISRML